MGLGLRIAGFLDVDRAGLLELLPSRVCGVFRDTCSQIGYTFIHIIYIHTHIGTWLYVSVSFVMVL